MIFLLFCIGLIFSAFATYGSLFLFPRIALLDFPERYGLTRKKKPYPGGLIFVVLTLIFCFVFPVFLWILPVFIPLSILSFLDDKKPIPASLRLFFHLLFASILFFIGIRINFIGNPFVPFESINLTTIPVLSFLLTVLWIVILQNALNWFDGIPGLSVGISGIGFLTLGLFGLIRPEVAWESSLPDFLSMSFYLSGICFGAFLFFWKGKIILGDTGSQTLGLLLAIFSLFAGTKIAVTLFVLCLPLLDFLMVLVRRIWIDKKSPFSGDLKHIHHNMSFHIGEPKTALLFMLISALFGASTLFLHGLLKLTTLFIISLGVVLLNVWALKKRS